ncbi:MAG: Rrf2 family transcriptional regulator [Candidatus Omnitrophica bacterium]|nr:Rrf2 family transcriptional regulator [Candidatus Omnitrophota bacterium]
MKLSTRSRYGLRLMFELALDYGNGPVFLKDIAKKEDISDKYLSQLVIPLKSSGLINSIRGAHGGYILSRSPADISVKDVIEVLEGDLNPVECVKDSSLCNRVSLCPTRNIWHKLSEKIKEVLESFTLEDLVKEYKSGKNGLLMYNI